MEVRMAGSKDSLRDRLARYYRQIKISVVGRKSGRTISIPVWFVVEGDKLHLLPVQGSDTQWYKNVLKNPSIRISARGEVYTRSRRRAKKSIPLEIGCFAKRVWR